MTPRNRNGLGFVYYEMAFRSKRKEEDELTRYIHKHKQELRLKNLPTGEYLYTLPRRNPMVATVPLPSSLSN